MLELEKHGEVLVLRMDSGENRFTGEAIARWNALLDEAAAAGGGAGAAAGGGAGAARCGACLLYTSAAAVE